AAKCKDAAMSRTYPIWLGSLARKFAPFVKTGSGNQHAAVPHRSPKGRFLRSGLGSRINEHRELLHILHPPGDESPTDQEGMTQWQVRAGFASGCRPHHHDRLRWRDIVAGRKRIDAG